MDFKEQRRMVTQALDQYGQITREYWDVCDSFLQMLDLKQSENLRMLLKGAADQERIQENIKSEIATYAHMAIGLGKRYPMPEDLDISKAVKLQRQLMDRVIQIYGRNSGDDDLDVYRVHKVCQCVADDEFKAETGYEPEQIELFLHMNKQSVSDMRERSASYDYLQKGGESGQPSEDNESQQSGSSRHSSEAALSDLKEEDRGG